MSKGGHLSEYEIWTIVRIHIPLSRKKGGLEIFGREIIIMLQYNRDLVYWLNKKDLCDLFDVALGGGGVSASILSEI